MVSLGWRPLLLCLNMLRIVLQLNISLPACGSVQSNDLLETVGARRSTCWWRSSSILESNSRVMGNWTARLIDVSVRPVQFCARSTDRLWQRGSLVWRLGTRAENTTWKTRLSSLSSYAWREKISGPSTYELAQIYRATLSGATEKGRYDEIKRDSSRKKKNIGGRRKFRLSTWRKRNLGSTTLEHKEKRCCKGMM